jgi:hypothetical protein
MVALTGIESDSRQSVPVHLAISTFVFGRVQSGALAFMVPRSADVLPWCCPVPLDACAASWPRIDRSSDASGGSLTGHAHGGGRGRTCLRLSRNRQIGGRGSFLRSDKTRFFTGVAPFTELKPSRSSRITSRHDDPDTGVSSWKKLGRRRGRAPTGLRKLETMSHSRHSCRFCGYSIS